MRRHLLFIFNPYSGKGKIKDYLFDIIDIFTKADYIVTVHPTQKPGDCTAELSSTARTYDLIVVSGGDGTLNEAVSGMLSLPPEKRVPIGYIPAGTMNDFASGNGIPKTMVDAAASIIDGKLIKYDIGKLDGKTFIYVAAFGAFTDVSYDTPQLTKHLLGNAAYAIEGMKRLYSLEGIYVDIKTDEGEKYSGTVFVCLIMNSTSVAGIDVGDFYDINTNDGLFEIVIIPKTDNIIDLATLIASIKNGEQSKEGIRVIRTTGAEIKTNTTVRWTLDGEYGGEMAHAVFKVIPDAVDFIINDNKEI